MPSEFPRIERPPVNLPPLGEPLDSLWSALTELADRLVTVRWTLVGGQMVLLHALEHETIPPRVSADIDAVADVRVVPRAVARVVGELRELGFVDTGTSPEGYRHRFARAHDGSTAVVDVLVPEGLSSRTDTTTIHPGRAFPVDGATQALARSEAVPVRTSRGVVTWVPRPSVLGAVVAKAAAATTDRRNGERHVRDLAFLCGLLDDPLAAAADLGRKDRTRLQRADELMSADVRVWDSADDAAQARLAWRLLQPTRR